MMKTIILLTLLTLSAISQAQGWRAESTEYQLQQELSNSKSDKPTLSGSQAAYMPQTKSVISRPQYHGAEDIWVYDGWLTLEQDLDHDGYYSGFTLSFDVDTYYNSAVVYAVLYLGVDDKFHEYHSTSVFTLYGEDSEDYFEVNTTLIEGFPSNDYEILIEVYDADTHDLVAIYDGYNDSDLLYVPLESVDYEYIEPQVVVSNEGGSNSLATIAALLALAGWRRMRLNKPNQRLW